MSVQLLQHRLLKRLSFLLGYCLRSFVKDQSPIFVWVYFWLLFCSIDLSYPFIRTTLSWLSQLYNKSWSWVVPVLQFYSLLSLFKFLFTFYILAVLGLCCWTQAFSCVKQGLLSNCGAQASQLTWSLLFQSIGSTAGRFQQLRFTGFNARGMWNLPGPGIEPESPALASEFLTSGSPGKSLFSPLILCLLFQVFCISK